MTINVEMRKRNFEALLDFVNVTVPNMTLTLAGNTVDSAYTAFVSDLYNDSINVVIVATDTGFTEVFPHGEVKKQVDIAGVRSDVMLFLLEDDETTVGRNEK